MRVGRWGLIAGLLAASLLASPLGVAIAQVREQSAEEFNAQARAQEQAYMRQWEAEQAAARAQSDSSSPQLEYGVETTPTASDIEEQAAGSDSVTEAAGLRCLNENRASVQLSPVTLQEFREGRAAGTIATPENLCGRDYVGGTVPLAEPNSAEASDPTPDLAAANAHFERAAAWRQLQDQITFFSLIIVALLLYFIPAIIAFRRGHHYRWPIFAFNVGAAWTGLGWIGTLVWSLWPAQSAIIDPIISDASGGDRR